MADGQYRLQFRTVAGKGESLATTETAFTIVRRVRGDLDGDLDVDNADQALLMAALGGCLGTARYLVDADYDGDGCVTKTDLILWRTYRTDFNLGR